MLLIKKEFTKNLNQLNQLGAMESNLRISTQISYATYCSMVMTIATVGALSLTSIVLGSYIHFIGLGNWKNISLWPIDLFLFTVILFSVMFSVIYLLINQTWDDVLLNKLSDYIPVNAAAYRNLQEEVKANNGLDRQGLKAFIEFEKKALLLPPGKSPALSKFLSKNVKLDKEKS